MPEAKSLPEDDDRPRPRSRRDEDEDAPRERRPSPSRARRDEDEDAPRERQPRRPTRSHRDERDDDDLSIRQDKKLGLIIAGVAVAVAVSLLAVVCIYLMVSRDNKPAVAVEVKPVDAQAAAATEPTRQDVAGKTFDRPRADDDTTKARPAGQTVTESSTTAKPSAGTKPLGPKNRELPPELEEKIKKATVYVEITVGDKGASGSGFVVRSSDEVAYVVTNNHVISPDFDPPEDDPPARPGAGRAPGFPGRPPGFPGRPPGFPGRPPGFPGRPPGVPLPPWLAPAGQRPEPKRQQPEIRVMFYRGTPQQNALDAKVVATDAEADLAVLRVDGGRNYPLPLDLAAEADLEEFTPVRIYGFPLGRKDLLVSNAVVSQLVRNSHGELTDVQLNIKEEVTHGNSGGPVVDTMGRLVGVTVAKLEGKHLGWAVPTTKLATMFKGAVQGGVLYQLRQKGAAIAVAGETWRFDRKNRVEDRTALDITVDSNAPNQKIQSDEFHAVAFMSDPMKKIRSIQVRYGVKRPDSVVRDGDGWAPLHNAQQIEMSLNERTAKAIIKIPDGAADNTYAVQFIYANADGKTVCTEPHDVRFTFPKAANSVTVDVTGLKDDASRRYVSDSLRELVPGGSNLMVSHTKDGVKATIDPVDDPKALAGKINFGTATVSGWTISVVAKDIKPPPPTAAEVAEALGELKSNDNRVRSGAADRLAKCYAVLPDRRAEVAKELVKLMIDKDFWVSRAGVNALKLWAGPEVLKDLIAYLESVDVGKPQGDLIALIAPYKAPAAAKALANCLTSGFNRGPAEAALKAIGPAAEKAVIPILENKDGWTVRSACSILREIGTKESIAPIQALIDKTTDPFTANAARDALQTIQTLRE